jgi:hypothetical protein
MPRTRSLPECTGRMYDRQGFGWKAMDPKYATNFSQVSTCGFDVVPLFNFSAVVSKLAQDTAGKRLAVWLCAECNAVAKRDRHSGPKSEHWATWLFIGSKMKRGEGDSPGPG